MAGRRETRVNVTVPPATNDPVALSLNDASASGRSVGSAGSACCRGSVWVGVVGAGRYKERDGKTAVCTYYTTTVPEYLICSGARNPVTVTLPATGRPWVRDKVRSVHGLSSPALGPIFDYGMTWRGGASFRCVSQRRGLTCRNVVGHGFVLGRVRGHSTF